MRPVIPDGPVFVLVPWQRVVFAVLVVLGAAGIVHGAAERRAGRR